MECVSAHCEKMDTPSKTGRSSLLVGCYTFLSGFRLPWLPPCFLEEVDEPAPIAVSDERILDDGSSSLSAGDWYHDLLLQPPQAVVPTSTNFEDRDPDPASDNDSISATAADEHIFDDGSSSLSAGNSYHNLSLQPPQAIVPMSTNHEETNPNTVSDNDSISATAPLPETPSFTLFPHLPKDLRLEIYELCHPPPRNVILAFPQNPVTRARIRNWDKQWIFPPLLVSQFSHLLVNHETRDFFHSQYQLIFADFPSTEVMKKKGRKAGWYFNPRKDSLCFGDGVRGLRWFMGEFPDEDVWERVRYIDVDIDRRAFHTEKSVDPLYFSREVASASVLAKMKELRLVSMRVIVVRKDQWRNRKNGHWHPWEHSGKMLKEWLSGKRGAKAVKLAMQYIWCEGGVITNALALAPHNSSLEGHEAFLKRYPGVVEEDVKRRWKQMEVFLQDGGNKTQAVYDMEKEIFCRSIIIELPAWLPSR